eukprot:COSAG04_NODE_2967_length_3336_cov_3.236330_3_plen_53_part_00
MEHDWLERHGSERTAELYPVAPAVMCSAHVRIKPAAVYNSLEAPQRQQLTNH